MGDKRKVAAPSCDGMKKSGKKWNGTEGEVKVMVAGTGIYGEKSRMSTRIITRLDDFSARSFHRYLLQPWISARNMKRHRNKFAICTLRRPKIHSPSCSTTVNKPHSAWDGSHRPPAHRYTATGTPPRGRHAVRKCSPRRTQFCKYHKVPVENCYLQGETNAKTNNFLIHRSSQVKT